jgi:hypothetical protein
MLNTPRIAPVQEVADLFGVKRDTVIQDLSRYGHFHGLRAIALGKKRVFIADDVERLFHREPQAGARKAA